VIELETQRDKEIDWLFCTEREVRRLALIETLAESDAILEMGGITELDGEPETVKDAPYERVKGDTEELCEDELQREERGEPEDVPLSQKD
jgi:hypothetical protein